MATKLERGGAKALVRPATKVNFFYSFFTDIKPYLTHGFYMVPSKEASNPIFSLGKSRNLHHTCATCSELPSNESFLILPKISKKSGSGA